MTSTKTPHNSTALNYKDAGVDIDAGNKLVQCIKPIAKKTHRPEVMADLGGFASLCQLPVGYKEPVLVSSTDGVGTKLKLALRMQRYDSIGIDLVAMCVNDLVVTGAEPLFFLDYYATGRLDVEMGVNLIGGIGRGCEIAGCALVGGETAEMPGVYRNKDFDLAGFCVGVAEKSNLITNNEITAGDKLIALPSSGPHSNGYSLIRKILTTHNINLESHKIQDIPLSNLLLEPTRIYVKPLLAVMKQVRLHGLCHITGGGLVENVPRALPQGLCARIDSKSWQIPSIFLFLQQKAQLTSLELFRIFNCGIGMVLITSPGTTEQLLCLLKEQGEEPFVLGDIIEDSRSILVTGLEDNCA